MAASFVQAVVSGYFSQAKEEIDAGAIEDFLSSEEAFQLIAIDQKSNITFTSAENIPEGASAIIFKKPKGIRINASNMAGKLSFHTFALADGPSTYLASNRESSKALGKRVIDDLGSIGRTLVENLESIESETELNGGHAFVVEILSSQRSDAKKDLVLRYADAFYAEFADKLIQKDSASFDIIIGYMEKLIKLIKKNGVENCEQTSSIVGIWSSIVQFKKLVASINSLCKPDPAIESKQFSTRGDVKQESEAEIEKLLERHKATATKELTREINNAGNNSRVLNICSKHSILLEHIQLDDKESLINKLKNNLTTESGSTRKTSFGSSKLVKDMMNSMWVEQSAKETSNVAKALKSAELLRKAKNIHLREQEKRKELFSTWQQQIEDEIGDLVLEIDKDQEVFSFNSVGQYLVCSNLV